MTSTILPTPTPERVLRANTEFDHDERFGPVDLVLSKVFLQAPLNTEIEDILLKVVLLNGLYNTNIYATTEMARHILKLNIDHDMNAGDPMLVERIATITLKETTRRHYSFATKYCNWHRPELFPIYDSLVKNILCQYRDRDGFASFTQHDLQNYANYKSVIASFRSYFGLEQFTFKQIDKYLWYTGRLRAA